MTIRVLVADDQSVVRDGVVLLLSSANDIEVVGEAGDGLEAVRLATELRPDVALVDLRMPGLDGTRVTEQLVSAQIGVRVLILTTFAEDEAVMPALRAGAVGYLTKDVTGESLLAAVRDVSTGRTVLDPTVQQRLVQLVVDAPDTARRSPEPVELQGLTRREVDVVKLVAQGLNNRQIARELSLGESTIKTHLNHVLAKLSMDDRAPLIAWAWRHGLVDDAVR